MLPSLVTPAGLLVTTSTVPRWRADRDSAEAAGQPGRCHRHRYLSILRQRSVSTDEQRSMSITITRTNPGRCLAFGVSTMSAAAQL